MSELTAVPEYIGPYRVVRPLARGGMAEVYEVADPASGEHVALKLLMQAGSALPRFNREYEAMTRLNHPNIVRVYHYGFHEDMPWLTMELLDGVPLQKRVKLLGRPGSTQRTTEVLRVTWHLADALQYIHNRGLVHRDLKSANVIVLPDGRVKLLDFGTAHLENPVEAITQEGEFVGTFAYASPEQLLGGEVNYQSDLYSFGVLLYRLATGRRPFASDKPHELARMHLKVTPKLPRELVPNLPEWLEQIVMWLLEKKPEDRPHGAGEIQAAIQEMTRDDISRLPGTGIAVRADRPVGRDDELRRATDMLDRTVSGKSILVVGAAGSNRLRFTQAVASSASVDGWALASINLQQKRALSLLLQALRSMALDIERGDLIADLQEPAKGVTLLPDVRDRVTRAAGEVLVGVAKSSGDKPTLVVLQNGHLLGPVALGVLVDARRILVNAKARVNFLVSSDKSVDGPFSPLRTRWADDNRVDLGPLTPRQVALSVGAMLHRRPPPAELARRLHAASGGQPGFVEEIVRELVANGSLAVHEHDGNRLEWAQGDMDGVNIAPGARELIDSQLRKVPVAHRRMLEGFALLDQTAPLELVAGVIGLDAKEAQVVAGKLKAKGWLKLGEKGWTMPRRLAREVLIQELNPARKRVIERNLANALAEGVPNARLVSLLLAADRQVDAVRVGLVVGEELFAKGEQARALEVLDLVAPLTGDVEGIEQDDLARLHLLHTTCLMTVRPTDMGTARSLMRAKTLAESGSVSARVDFTKARMQWIIGHYPNFRKFMLQAWETLDRDNDLALASSVALDLALSHLWSGEPRTAGEWYQRAWDLASRADDPLAEAHARLGMATLHYTNGALIEAEEQVETARTHFETIGNDQGHWESLTLRTQILRTQGRYSDALAMLYRKLPEARQGQASSLYVRMLLQTALCEVDLYRLGRAQECLDELDATLNKGEYLHLQCEAGLVRGRILMASGQLYEAEETLLNAQKRASTARLVILAELCRSSYAETLWLQGRHDESRDAFRAAVLGLIGTGDISALSEALIAQARALAEETDPETIFAGLKSVASQPMRVVQLEQLLATARHVRARGDEAGSKALYRKALLAMNALAKSLNDTDRAALRVHPWSQQIRGGLR